ncbi:hypothetical protein EAG_15249 [Camponotus floridanus]|uniref:Uncharacterized protein n=1 Tax=Camponotus floridanus TaxID=104421 RepID=E2A091_CAMFO|nr:hypothetical protein EAG_15249 [Camponotus floridanus]
MTGRRDGDRRVGSSDRGSQPMVGEMSEERHGKARICARNLAGNNKGQQPAGSTIFLAGTQNDGGTQPCFPSLPLLWEQQSSRVTKWPPEAFPIIRYEMARLKLANEIFKEARIGACIAKTTFPRRTIKRTMVFVNRRERYETRKILTTTGQDKPRTVVEGELTSRRVFCSSRPQADWELRKPNVRSSWFALCCLPAFEPNSGEAQQSRAANNITQFEIVIAKPSIICRPQRRARNEGMEVLERQSVDGDNEQQLPFQPNNRFWGHGPRHLRPSVTGEPTTLHRFKGSLVPL